MALLALGAAAAWFAPRNRAERAYTLTLNTPPGVTMGVQTTDIALSPDGRQVLFVAADTLAGPRLWLRSLDRENARVFEGTDNSGGPFWSPDGRHAGFFADGKLKTLDLATGAVHVLADAPLARGGSWGDGVILYQPLSLGPLWRVPVEGGTPEVATALDTSSGDTGHRFPQFMPDGRHFTCSVLGKGDNEAAFGELGRKGLKKLFRISDSSGPLFAGPDWIVGCRSDAMKAQHIDPRSGRLWGPAVDVPGLRVVSPDANGAPGAAASGNGVIIQRAAFGLPQRLEVVDRQGRAVAEIAAPEGLWADPSVSPDGTRLAVEYDAATGPPQVWLADLGGRGMMQPLTSDGANMQPLFSPDGRTLALTHAVVGRGPQQDLYTMTVGEPGSLRLVQKLPDTFNTPHSWSPDGHGVLLRCQGTTTRQDLYYVDLSRTGADRLVPVAASSFNEPSGTISPDGHWVAYVSDESGRYECRVRAFPRSTGIDQVVSRGAWAGTNGGGRLGEPTWRRDGRELLYVGPDGRMLMTVAVTPGNPPVFGEPRPLFRLSSATQEMGAFPNLDRFVLSITRDEVGHEGAQILVNWPRLLDASR